MKKTRNLILMLVVICILITGCIGIPAYGAVIETPELDLINLIPKELFIIAVAVYCIAEFAKKTEKIPSWVIPIFVLIVAVILIIAYSAVVLEQGLTDKTIVNGIVYGILIAMATVYCNQLIKQIFIKRLE